MADPIILTLLGTLAGAGTGALGWLLNQNPATGPKATNVNQDYKNNPIWQQIMGMMGGTREGQNEMMGGMKSSLSDMSGFLANAVSSSKAYDPNAFWKDFMAAQPEMQGLISGPTGSFKSAAQANLADFVKEATAGTASELSGMGSLYSGALGSIAGQKIGSEAGKYNTQLAQLESGMLSNLYGLAMPAFSRGREFQTQNLVNTYLSGAQSQLGAANTYLGGANMYANQLASMLGIGADLSAPVYVTQPGLGDALMGGLGAGMNFGSGLGMLGGQGQKQQQQTMAPWLQQYLMQNPLTFGAMPYYAQ